MKKFTKWCLTTALVLFIIGCAFGSAFGALGGRAQLKNLDVVHDWGWHGLKWIFRWGNNGLNFGFFDEDDELWDDYAGAQNIASTSKMEQTAYKASDFTDIDIELGAVYLVIEESEDEYVWIKNDSSVKTVKYGVEGGIFRLYGGRSVKAWDTWDSSPRGTVYLRLPKEMKLSLIELEVGAGKLENVSFEADTINLEAGAGKFDMKNLTADIINISMGAGEMDIDGITAGTVSVSVGAGTLDAKNVDIKDMSISVGMGNVTIQGSITGDMDADCAMGNMDMTLQGAVTDHNYDIDCAMGNVKIGKNTYSGIGTERSIDNDSSSDFDISCSTGSIEIEFEN